jgi:hypothetical protein
MILSCSTVVELEARKQKVRSEVVFWENLLKRRWGKHLERKNRKRKKLPVYEVLSYQLLRP